MSPFGVTDLAQYYFRWWLHDLMYHLLISWWKSLYLQREYHIDMSTCPDSKDPRADIGWTSTRYSRFGSMSNRYWSEVFCYLGRFYLIPLQISNQKNQLILLYMTNMLTMEKIDLNHALASKQSGEEDTDFETTEMHWIVRQLPETSRYICCITNAHDLCIWDLYERRCTRIIETGIATSFQQFSSLKKFSLSVIEKLNEYRNPCYSTRGPTMTSDWLAAQKKPPQGKMSYRHGKFHCEDKTVIWSSYLHDGIYYTWKTAFLYLIRHLVSKFLFTYMEFDMMTSANGNIFRVTGHLCRVFTGPRWIPRTKASGAERWCFLWSAPEYTVE